MTVLQVHSLPVLANQHRQIFFCHFFASYPFGVADVPQVAHLARHGEGVPLAFV
jgi:hypothetical protein